MNLASILAWIITAALCVAALFIVVVICILIIKGVRSLLRRMQVLDKEA